MLFQKGELKILWPFYLASLIFGLSTLITPFIVIYFRELNYSFFQIAILTAIGSVAVVLFEVPTGAFADGLSRKYSVIIGYILSGIGVILVAFTQDFYIMLLLFTLMGLGITFISGAYEAWIVDNLTKHKREDLRQDFFIKNVSIISFGAIFAPLVGAFIVKSYSIKPLWIIFGMAFILNSFLLAILAEELYRPKKINFSKTLKETIKTSKKGIRYTLTHKTILLLVLAGLFASFMDIANDGWQPLLVNLSMPTYSLGFLYSITAVFLMISPFLSKLFKNMKVKHAVSITTFIKMVLIFSIIFIHPPLFLIAAIIYILSSGFHLINTPLLSDYFHKFVPTNIRATVTSTVSMIGSLSVAILSLPAGYLLDLFGPQKIIAHTSLFGILAIITYQRIKD